VRQWGSWDRRARSARDRRIRDRADAEAAGEEWLNAEPRCSPREKVTIGPLKPHQDIIEHMSRLYGSLSENFYFVLVNGFENRKKLSIYKI